MNKLGNRSITATVVGQRCTCYHHKYTVSSSQFAFREKIKVSCTKYRDSGDYLIHLQ